MGTAVFGAPEFKARSGRQVKPQEDGSIRFELAHGYLDRNTAMDAEEFFQAKRDAELGRWRDPVNPRYVVYPGEEGAALVLDEVDGTAERYSIRYRRVSGTPMRAAANRYFDAHPEKVYEDGIYVAKSSLFDILESRIVKRRDGVWLDAGGCEIEDPTVRATYVRLTPEDAS